MRQIAVDEQDGDRTVLIEDDGRTAYAYLVEGGAVVSDVWLYNRDGVDDDPSWNDPRDMPFPNKRKYMSDERFALEEAAIVRIAWDRSGGDIYADDVRVARLQRGAKPGWSCLAVIDSPLARPLHSSPAPADANADATVDEGSSHMRKQQ